MNKKRTTIWLSQDVMDRLDEMTKTDDSKSRSEFIERAIKFYGDLAGLIGMNEQYFCRFFKKVIGRSASQVQVILLPQPPE